jgi:hypothetical protein
VAFDAAVIDFPINFLTLGSTTDFPIIFLEIAPRAYVGNYKQGDQVAFVSGDN